LKAEVRKHTIGIITLAIDEPVYGTLEPVTERGEEHSDQPSGEQGDQQITPGLEQNPQASND
jgi:hypothetical protein